MVSVFVGFHLCAEQQDMLRIVFAGTQGVGQSPKRDLAVSEDIGDCYFLRFPLHRPPLTIFFDACSSQTVVARRYIMPVLMLNATHLPIAGTVSPAVL